MAGGLKNVKVIHFDFNVTHVLNLLAATLNTLECLSTLSLHESVRLTPGDINLILSIYITSIKLISGSVHLKNQEAVEWLANYPSVKTLI